MSVQTIGEKNKELWIELDRRAADIAALKLELAEETAKHKLTISQLDWGMEQIADLRNPPPETIEAGAKAMWEKTGGFPECNWAMIDQSDRNAYMTAWLASLRAALDVTP